MWPLLLGSSSASNCECTRRRAIDFAWSRSFCCSSASRLYSGARVLDRLAEKLYFEERYLQEELQKSQVRPRFKPRLVPLIDVDARSLDAQLEFTLHVAELCGDCVNFAVTPNILR